MFHKKSTPNKSWRVSQSLTSEARARGSTWPKCYNNKVREGGDVLADLSGVWFERVASVARVCDCGIDSRRSVTSEQCKEEKRVFP